MVNYKTHIMVNTGVGWDGKKEKLVTQLIAHLADSHLHRVWVSSNYFHCLSHTGSLLLQLKYSSSLGRDVWESSTTHLLEKWTWKKPPANHILELFLIQEKLRGAYHTYKGTFRMQNSCTLLLLLCQFGTQTIGMEGIRNDLPLSFLYVFSCWRWDSVQRSAFLGSKKIRICERKEGKWRERDGEWNWGFMKLTVSILWRFSVKSHVLITQAFILVIICTNRNWFSDIF